MNVSSANIQNYNDTDMMQNKSVDSTLLDRRSIRRYERQAIDEDDLEFIRRAIQNTPTSYNGQQFSVIEVNDHDLKLELAEVIGQKQVKTCNTIFFFLADYNKIRVAAEAKGLEVPDFDATADGLIVGVVDASLAMMSAIVAAESCHLGTCPIGYARTVDPKRISQLLMLPDHTFVVCALAVGVPREYPDIKPKQPLDIVVFHNRYGIGHLRDQLLRYDDQIHQYNLTRAGGGNTDHDWVGHILDYYREGMKYHLTSQLHPRGFLTRD